MRRRQGTLRKVQITPHAPRCRCLSHPITILAKENPNSFARMPDFWEIRAISHQSSHPRRKTSHFFCKDYHPAGYYVCNSPHFKQSPPRTRRKESCSKLCVATQNHAAEHSRGHDAKKTSRNYASWHRTTQQSTVSFARITTPPETLSIIHPVSRTTTSRLTMLSVKQGILRTKYPTLQ